jgi:hypothetical protein
MKKGFWVVAYRSISDESATKAYAISSKLLKILARLFCDWEKNESLKRRCPLQALCSVAEGSRTGILKGSCRGAVPTAKATGK